MSSEIVERAVRDCFLSTAALPDTVVERRDDSLAVRTSLGLPFFNGVPFARLTNADAERRVRETLASFREHEVPFRWWVMPSSAPADLPAILMANGFRHVYDAPGMVIELDSLPRPKEIADFAVARIEDEDALRFWTDVFAEGFHRPPDEAQKWNTAFTRLGLGPTSAWRHLVGFLGGFAVAIASVCIGSKVAGVYDVATLPRARGRGIGSAITLAALEESKRAGCRVASLQSSEMAFGVYRSLGFRHCCDLTLYDWRPEYDR